MYCELQCQTCNVSLFAHLEPLQDFRSFIIIVIIIIVMSLRYNTVRRHQCNISELFSLIKYETNNIIMTKWVRTITGGVNLMDVTGYKGHIYIQARAVLDG